MSQNCIKAGYRITVDSWENDGDNHNTEIIEGLSREECELYVSFCKLLKSQCKFSNMYEPSDEELEAFHANFPDMDEDDITDCLNELGLISEDFYTRVCSKFVVEYIPQDILIDDVTHEF